MGFFIARFIEDVILLLIFSSNGYRSALVHNLCSLFDGQLYTDKSLTLFIVDLISEACTKADLFLT